MISDDQYAGLCMTVKSLQKQNAELLSTLKDIEAWAANSNVSPGTRFITIQTAARLAIAASRLTP